jgi:hypothetical protein
VLLPFAEPEFIERSILAAKQWRAVARALLRRDRRLWPTCRDASCRRNSGPLACGRRRGEPAISAFERCNLWLLYTALDLGSSTRCASSACGTAAAATGRAAPAHMYNEVKRRTGRVSWLDTRTAVVSEPRVPAPARRGIR